MNLESLASLITRRSQDHSRYLIAIAGPPGSGKSTLAHQLSSALPSCAIAAMDGFHYDNAVLDQLHLLHRKGAPETFDFAGFSALLSRLRAAEPLVAVPVFDREVDLARAAAALISVDTKHIIVEGNYLLLDQPPWCSLASLFHLSIFLQVPRDELRRRLLQRWHDLGYAPAKAEHWVSTNDMPNVDLVLGSRRPEDVLL